jgi:hypothetical protein
LGVWYLVVEGRHEDKDYIGREGFDRSEYLAITDKGANFGRTLCSSSVFALLLKPLGVGKLCADVISFSRVKRKTVSIIATRLINGLQSREFLA